MRLLSDDGTVDVPYNLCSVCILKAYDCYKVLSVLNTEHYTLATYSTEEKALKAMEMLRKQYSQLEVAKTISHGSAEELFKCKQEVVNEIVKQFQEITIFQFPKDEEIEV